MPLKPFRGLPSGIVVDLCFGVEIDHGRFFTLSNLPGSEYVGGLAQAQKYLYDHPEIDSLWAWFYINGKLMEIDEIPRFELMKRSHTGAGGLGLVGLVLCVLILWLTGCATSTPSMVKTPPVVDDLVGWSAPTAPQVPESSNAVNQEPPTARSPREKVYAYSAGAVYAITVPLGAPMDIVLQPGEQIHNLVGGDRSPTAEGESAAPPWEVKEGLSGSATMSRPHVFITVTKAGLRTGVSITTTKRTYYLDCRSVAQTPVRSVRWTYPDDESVFAKALEPSLLPDPIQPQRYHVPYTIETSTPRPAWSMGLHAVDDGSKTYVIFPPTVTTMDAPLIRLIGPNGPELVNARQVGSVIVLDRIMNRAELRLGTGPRAEVVTIQREAPITITCPGEPQCPVWPSQQARSLP